MHCSFIFFFSCNNTDQFLSLIFLLFFSFITLNPFVDIIMCSTTFSGNCQKIVLNQAKMLQNMLKINMIVLVWTTNLQEFLKYPEYSHSCIWPKMLSTIFVFIVLTFYMDICLKNFLAVLSCLKIHPWLLHRFDPQPIQSLSLKNKKNQ